MKDGLKNISYKTQINGTPVSYKLKDQTDKSFKTVFYNKELHKVTDPDTYHIKKFIVWQKGPSKESLVAC